jgi:RNA polymerase I-specific transcription initiation factor RRN6
VASGVQNISNDLLKQTGTLLRVHPELASGSNYLRENELSSRAITAVTENFRPDISKLLSIGNATYPEGSRTNRILPIVAFAWGESATTLKFVLLESKSMMEISPDIRRANIPCIGSHESGWWTGNGATVRQVCFSETVDEASTWMAARLPCSTRIFRPLYHRMAVAASYCGDEPAQRIFPNSRLDPNPLLNIPISLTGGYAHADVAFNPWYQYQFAVIDDHGNWSVWEIQGKYQREHKSKWRADMSFTGCLSQPSEASKEKVSDQGHHDGWAAINWVGDINRLLVCDRRSIVLYRINCDPMKQYRINLDLETSSEWILDVKRSPSNQSHVFVLTSSKIFWLNVVSDDAIFDHHEDEVVNVSVLLSWRHFRGQEDTSLQISLINGKNGECSFPLKALNAY